MKGETSLQHDWTIVQCELSLEQEEELVKYSMCLLEHEILSTRRMIVNFASEIAQGSMSDIWVTCFLECRRERPISNWTDPLVVGRYESESFDKYKRCFGLISKTIAYYDIRPENTCKAFKRK